MSPNLSPIKNIVVVMMENRSFDHLLGYLSLPPYNKPGVDGQSTDPAWLARYTNNDRGLAVQPFLSDNPYTLPDEFDPPHERPNIAAQLGPFANNAFPMNCFVSAIPDTVSNDPAVRRLVMSYFEAEQVPITQFFASNFAICNRWFSSLPAGTQANRLMSMSGFTEIQVNQTPLPKQDLVYDWLTARGISWRVYHEGIPFFALMLKWIVPILFDEEHFRSFDKLEDDLAGTPPNELPQVIFVEPAYQDAPHLDFATDDHAPSGVSNGQEFLMRVYNAVTTSPSFWRGAVMIVDYDEHGGYFDHVSPPPIPTEPPQPGLYPRFETLGVRVPAYVISPFVQPGLVSQALLDHTSVLKFLGEKFDPAGSYSAVVDSRPVESVSALLNFDNPVLDPPSVPALDAYLAQRPAAAPLTVPAPNTALQKAFSDAVANMRQQGAGPNHPKFGSLLKQMDAAGK